MKNCIVAFKLMMACITWLLLSASCGLVLLSLTTFFFYIGVGKGSGVVTLHYNFLATKSPESGDCWLAVTRRKEVLILCAWRNGRLDNFMNTRAGKSTDNRPEWLILLPFALSLISFPYTQKQVGLSLTMMESTRFKFTSLATWIKNGLMPL